MGVKRVVFMRPGETAWNKIGRWQGNVAVPLNEQGRAQVQRLAQFVRPLGFAAIYSSDLHRAKDTADIIAGACGLEARYDQRLRERHMGEWQGLTLAEIQSWYPESYARMQADPDGFQIPGGESRKQVTQRVRAAFEDILLRGGEMIGIISHATALRLLLADLVPDCNPYTIRFRNMSVTTLVHEEDGTWSISQLDDVTHLEGLSSMSFPEVESLEKE